MIGENVSLRIFGPGSLTLDNNDHNAHECPPFSPSCTVRDDSIVNGIIELRDSGEDAGDLIFITNNHTFAGEGRIEDIKAGGRIEIDPDIFFLNKLIDYDTDPLHFHGFAGIHGDMYIEGRDGGTVDGEFRNHGRVQALAIGLEPTLTIDAVTKDNEDAEWFTSCGATLLFKREATDLEGDFSDDPYGSTFSSGEFSFEADIWTCGTFTRNGCCGLVFTNNAEFSYADYVTTNSCTNPGTSASNPATCVDPFVASTEEDPDYCGT